MAPPPLGMRKQKPRPVCLKTSFAGIPRWIPPSSTKYFLLRNRISCLESVVYSASGAYFSRIVVVFSACASPGKERRQSGGQMKRKTVFFLKLWWIQKQSLTKQGIFPSYPTCCSCTVLSDYRQDSVVCKGCIGDTAASVKPGRKAKMVWMDMYFHIDQWTKPPV